VPGADETARDREADGASDVAVDVVRIAADRAGGKHLRLGIGGLPDGDRPVLPGLGDEFPHGGVLTAHGDDHRVGPGVHAPAGDLGRRVVGLGATVDRGFGCLQRFRVHRRRGDLYAQRPHGGGGVLVGDGHDQLAGGRVEPGAGEGVAGPLLGLRRQAHRGRFLGEPGLGLLCGQAEVVLHRGQHDRAGGGRRRAESDAEARRHHCGQP
jgi:hypothetical protein